MMTLITGKQKQAIFHGSMETIFVLGENGNLIANTRVKNKSRFRAIVGGVIILLMDSERRPLWNSHARRYSVEGCWIDECDRTYRWTEDVPLEVLPQIKGYSILQNQDIHWLNMLGQRRKRFAQWLDSDDGQRTLDQIQRAATMLPESETRFLEIL